jgi:hypothetical protein
VEILSVTLTAVATILALVVAIRQRQLSRPTLGVYIGSAVFDEEYKSVVKAFPPRLVIYSMPPIPRDHIVVPVAISIVNHSSLAITSLAVQLEFDSSCLLDQSRIVESSGRILDMGNIVLPGRSAERFGSAAQVTIDIQLIRPRQPVTVWEMLRMPRRYVPSELDQERHSRLNRTWRGVQGFCSAVELRLVAWSANCDPIENSVVVAVCESSSDEETSRIVKDMIDALWAAPPSPDGGRRWFIPRKTLWSMETAESLILAHDALTLGPAGDWQLDPTVEQHARHAVIRFKLPAWGFGLPT